MSLECPECSRRYRKRAGGIEPVADESGKDAAR
jgi:hypothetical protein